MTTVVRQTGWVDWERDPGKRNVLQTSDGRSIVVFMDPNNSSPVAGWGARDNVTRMYVYEATNADKSNWTLRATITAPAGTTFVDNHFGSYSCDLFSDNSIGIVAKGETGWLYYCKVTTGTWAVSAWETVATSVSLTWMAVDISISDTNAVLVAAQYIKTVAGDYSGAVILMRGTTTGTWATINTLTGQASSGAIRAFTHDISCTWVNGGSAGSRDFAYAFAITVSGQDAGVRLYTATVNEAGGSGATNHTFRAAYTQNDVSYTANYTLKARSILLFPLSAAGQDFVLSTQTFYPKPKFTVVGWQKVAGVWTNTMPASTSTTSGSASMSMGGMTQVISAGIVTFLTNVLHTGGGGWELLSNIVKCANSGGARWGTGLHYFNDLNVSNPYLVMGGTGTQFASNVGPSEVIYGHRYTSGKYDLVHDFVPTMRVPAGHTPAAGEAVNTSQPALTMTADLDREFSQTDIKAKWLLASNSLFTNDVRTFTQDDSKFQTVDNTKSSGKTVIIRDTLPAALDLFQGTWYIKAAHVDEYGSVSAYDAYTSFTVSHPPTAVPVTPTGYASVVFGSGDQQFTWEFHDTYPVDAQTAYQVVIENADTQAVLYDSGKVVTTANTYTKTFVVGDKNTLLRWKVRLWDSDDVVGPYSDYELFTIVDAGVVTFNSPLEGGTVTTALPTTQFTVTTLNGRVVTKYRLTISQGEVTVFDSQWVPAPVGGYATGSVITYSSTQSVLENNEDYTYQVRIVDNLNTEGRAQVSAHTTWVVPPPPDLVAADLTPYNTEDQGYVSVEWVAATPDTDFRAWVVYRRDRLVDTYTGLDLEVGPYNELGRIFDENVQEFHDYYAPSGYECDYVVVQLVDRFGDQIPSLMTGTVTVNPSSDGYWFIIPENESSIPDAFRVSNVTADGYTDEYEKEIFTVIGGGRKVDEGQHLGLTGTLTAQLRDSPGQSARQKKHRLEIMRESSTAKLYMRTPFGDLYRTYINDLQVSRIAGVGTSEFCDVTVPYLEVAD